MSCPLYKVGQNHICSVPFWLLCIGWSSHVTMLWPQWHIDGCFLLKRPVNEPHTNCWTVNIFPLEPAPICTPECSVNFILDYAAFKLVLILANSAVCTIDTTLLEWISEFTARAYTTPDSAVSYLSYAQSQMALTKFTPSFALWRSTAAKNCENTIPVQAECGLMYVTGTTWKTRARSFCWTLSSWRLWVRQEEVVTRSHRACSDISPFWRSTLLVTTRWSEFSLLSWPSFSGSVEVDNWKLS